MAEATGNQRSSQPDRASSIAAGLIVLLIFVTPVVGFVWLRMMSQSAAEESVLSHARDMLIRHYARTNGGWPRSWEDLQEDFEPADANYGTPSFNAMRQAVQVDFAFDVESLDGPANAAAPPRVLWLKDRLDTDAVHIANSLLIDALRNRRHQ